MDTWEKVFASFPPKLYLTIFFLGKYNDRNSFSKAIYVSSATRPSFLFFTSQLIQNTYPNFLNNWDKASKQQTLSLYCADSFQALFILHTKWGRVLWENKEWDHVIKDYLIMDMRIEL